MICIAYGELHSFNSLRKYYKRTIEGLDSSDVLEKAHGYLFKQKKKSAVYATRHGYYYAVKWRGYVAGRKTWLFKIFFVSDPNELRQICGVE